MAEAPSQPASSISCSICGDPLKPNDRFCASCGALVNACRSCGQRLVAGDRFCPSCGVTADSALVTARVSGGGEKSTAHSPWTGIFDKLQTATLGEFQVIRELGRGGMAAVYLAHDIHLDRKVAIKVMSPMLASDQSMVERFRREAKTGAGLKHPNIGTVHRVLEGEGLYFFVMDFIRGRPLDAIIHRNGVLTVPVTRALLHQIGSGLAYAHRRKIYHRDVKPGNVLVSGADGTAVVTDFGIAKVAESPNQTQTGAIVGTPAYMAPEQVLGKEITGAVDQYALGVMAYEMLTGAPPFVGTSFVVMHAHTEVQPRSIRESRPDCPQELDDAIMRMLAKDPSQRWPSLPHALAAMGATTVSEDDPIRDELVRLATPDGAETERFATNTPLSPAPPTVTRAASVAMVAISPPPDLIEVGDSFRLAASARDMQGAEVAGVPIEWATNDSNVLRVHSDGSVTALAPGSAEISAVAGRARGAVLLTVDPGRVQTVQMTIPPGLLMAGDRIQLAARVMDKHQRQLGYAVRWGVGDPNIARVSPDGVLEARAPGTVEVFVESNGVRTAARVQIAPPAVAGVQLSFDPQRPAVGDRIRVTATPIDVHGRALSNRAFGWSLSDLTLVSIISDGVFEAVKTGTLRVTAACEGKSSTIDIAIASAPAASVTVSPAPHNVAVGNTFKLSAVVLDAKGNVLSDRRVEWSASDRSRASVSDDGTVTALSAGDVRIVASCEGKGASVAVTIRPVPVKSIVISGQPQAVYVRAPFRLTAAVSDARGAAVQRSVEWRSSNVAVMTIAASGQVTPLATGQARITATLDGVEATVDLTVVEPAIPKVVVVPAASPSTPPPAAAAGDASASAIFSPHMHPPIPAPTREVTKTPVVAPAVPGVEPQPASGSGRRMLIGAGVGAVVIVGAVVAMMNRSSPEPQPTSVPQQPPPVAAAPETTTSQPAATPPVTAPKQEQLPAPTTADASAEKRAAKTQPATTVQRPPITAVTPPPTAPKQNVPVTPVRDAFRISVASQAPLRVGESVMLRATVERTAGAGALPTTTWESRNPSVLRVDPNSGVATAVGEGQALVTAIAGDLRADLSVTVNAAPAPVAQTPAAQPQRAETPVTPAGASAEEIRSRGESALRQAAANMAAAIKAKNVNGATQLFADGRNDDAADMLKNLKDYYGLDASVARVGPPQFSDRSVVVEYQLNMRWTSHVGIPRNRSVIIRVEAERSGDGWTVTRQRILSGWR